MQLVILETPKPLTKLVSQLTGKEILAYKCPNSNTICIIAKFANWQYGFVPLNKHIYGGAYIGDSFQDTATKAAKERRVYAFDDVIDFSKALQNGTIY